MKGYSFSNYNNSNIITFKCGLTLKFYLTHRTDQASPHKESDWSEEEVITAAPAPRLSPNVPVVTHTLSKPDSTNFIHQLTTTQTPDTPTSTPPHKTSCSNQRLLQRLQNTCCAQCSAAIFTNITTTIINKLLLTWFLCVCVWVCSEGEVAKE